MGKEKASNIAKGTIITPMSGSQGDPIAGRCIIGATFVGPIQLNLGYGNTSSQHQMVSMGAESSIMCEHLLSNALNATKSCMPEPIRTNLESGEQLGKSDLVIFCRFDQITH